MIPEADFRFRYRFCPFSYDFRYRFWVSVPILGMFCIFVVPMEIKANRQGSMQSLWVFMRKHGVHDAVRSSLEPFGEYIYYDPKDHDAARHLDILPLYALSNLSRQ